MMPVKMPHGSAAYPWTVTAFERADGTRVQARIPSTFTRDHAERFLNALQAATEALIGTTADPSPETEPA